MTGADVLNQAQRAGGQLVRFLSCDLSGVTRTKALHVTQLAHKLREGTGLTRAIMAMNLLDQLQVIEGMEPVGEIRLVPDPATFGLLPWTPASASLLGDQCNHDGRDWGACPRQFLRAIVARAAHQSHCYTSIGLDPRLRLSTTSSSHSGNRASWSSRRSTSTAPFSRQSRCATRPPSGPRTTRSSCTTRCAAWRSSRASGLPSSPGPSSDAIGSGCHVHLSLWDRQHDRNLCYDPQHPRGLSEAGRYFVGGLLHHLPTLLALTCPSDNSYRQLQPHAWSSAYTAWGFDNREAAVRVASPFRGREEQSANLELKAVDVSAKPYLALGAINACGLDGIERQLDPGVPCAHDPARLDEVEHERHGIRRLPTTMAAVLDNVEGNDVPHGALPELLYHADLVVRRNEERSFVVEEPTSRSAGTSTSSE